MLTGDSLSVGDVAANPGHGGRCGADVACAGAVDVVAASAAGVVDVVVAMVVDSVVAAVVAPCRLLRASGDRGENNRPMRNVPQTFPASGYRECRNKAPLFREFQSYQRLPLLPMG